MANFTDLRRFGLALPGVVEHPHMGQPALRAGGKMFALWWEPDKTTILKLEREHQTMLFEVRPEAFTPCKVGTGMWSYVDLAELTKAELKALVVEARAQVVPRKIKHRFSLAPAQRGEGNFGITATSATSSPRRRRSKVGGRKGI